MRSVEFREMEGRETRLVYAIEAGEGRGEEDWRRA
jgi:hypothetical protein